MQKSISTWYWSAAAIDSILCIMYMAGSIMELHPVVEGAKLSPYAWQAVRNNKHLYNAPVARYVGYTVGWAAVTASWIMYCSYGNPWAFRPFQFAVGVKVTTARVG